MISAVPDASRRSRSSVCRVALKSTSGHHTDEPQRVAVADGEPELHEAYEGLLSLLGYETVSCSRTGRELLISVRSGNPDVVLLEATLPDADGLNIATQILKQRLIPIVLITPGQDSALLERALRRGVLATVSKPFRLPALRDAMAHAIHCFDQLHAILAEGTQLVTGLNQRRRSGL